MAFTPSRHSVNGAMDQGLHHSRGKVGRGPLSLWLRMLPAPLVLSDGTGAHSVLLAPTPPAGMAS